MTTINNKIAEVCSNMVADIITPAINQYVSKLSEKFGIDGKDAMTIWDNMNPDFNISAVSTGKQMNNTGKKRAYTKKEPRKTSAWLQYAATKRPDVKAELAATGLEGKELFGAVAKKLGTDWKNMKAADKVIYQAMADQKNDAISDDSASESSKSDKPTTVKKSKKASIKKKLPIKPHSDDESDGAGEGSDNEMEESKHSEPPSPPPQHKTKKKMRRIPVQEDSDDDLEEEE